jgi:Tfp pilus assembly protein PilX
MTPPATRARRLVAAEEGFTMIFALGVMLITSFLVFAAFTAVSNDDHLSYLDTLQKQAYLAAATGLQEYEHKLQVNDDYWETSCEGPKGTVSGESTESYETSVLPANGKASCSTASPFETMIEKSGENANTFSVKSVGTAGSAHRTLIATFRVAGFLDFAYFTQYEDEDPYLTKQSECERYYEEKGKSRRSGSCGNIMFNNEDSVNGPMHTDDSALVECNKEVSFGREKQTPKDTVEINGGTWSPSEAAAKGPNSSPCGANGPVYYTTTGKFSEGPELRAPVDDTSVRAYVESGYEFTGRTEVTLSGEKITVKNANYNSGTATTIAWPANGLIYVRTGSSGCNFEYSSTVGGSDTTTKNAEEAECGTIVVHGTYTKSLTLAAQTDLIINGEILPTGVTGGQAPSGTATLGLMASRFVRIYHPCTTSKGNETGYLKNPWIYAALLSTSHSFLLDNWNCGSMMGELNIYGAIAQKFRGIVTEVGRTGYIKDYNYDERLATDEPPYFLQPLDAGWMIARETAPKAG